MNRIKALLIEETIMVIFIIFTAFCMSKHISIGNEILAIMLIMGVLIAVGKSIETIIDCTFFKNANQMEASTKFKRMLICFLLSLAAFFAIFCFFFNILSNSTLIILYSIISFGLAAIHLWISNAIDKLLHICDTIR